MLKKFNRVLKTAICIELILLSAFLIAPLFKAPSALAAHDAGTPTELYVTITSISLINSTGIAQGIFSGEKEVDLASVGAFGTAGLMDVDIPPGDYTGYRVRMSRTMRAKGTAVLGSTPYYTKAAHTGHSTAPAELETIDTGLDQHTEGSFASTVTLSGTVTLRLVVDIEKVLCYWDGADTQPKPEMTAGSMTVVPLPLALVFGQPGSKEVYEVTDNAFAGSKGRLAIMLDSNGNYVGAMGRAILSNSNTSSIFFTGGIPNNIFSDNGDGTYNMGAESWNDGSRIAWYMPAFRRTAVGASSTGSWSIIYSRASGNTTGTYTSIRTE